MTIAISGMHCASCSTLITMELEDMGVQAVIHRETERGDLAFDANQVTAESIIERIGNIGYTARVIENQAS